MKRGLALYVLLLALLLGRGGFARAAGTELVRCAKSADALRTLVIDIGGGHFHVQRFQGALATHGVEIPSGPNATPATLIAGLARHTASWGEVDTVSVGYNGVVSENRPAKDPTHMGPGWKGFDFAAALSKPVRVTNDAAMQALGGYRGQGTMLYYGLGTGLGTALVLPNNKVVPLELGWLPSGEGEESLQQRVGSAFHHMDPALGAELTARVRGQLALLSGLFKPDYVLLGGGAQQMVDVSQFPMKIVRGGNEDAFAGGLRLWKDTTVSTAVPRLKTNPKHEAALSGYGNGTRLYYSRTGEASALIVDGDVIEVNLSNLPYDNAVRFGETTVLQARGVRDEAISRLKHAFNADEVILGEGWGE